MEIITLLNHQRSAIKRSSLPYLIATLALLAIALQPYVPTYKFTRDVTQLAEVGFWYGAISTIGVLFWCATTAICFFSFIILKAIKVRNGRSMLLFASMLSLFLLIDDQFLVHDWIFPEVLGLSEKHVLAIYPISIVYLLVYYREEILSSSFLILLSSLSFLALSVLVDLTVPDTYEFAYLLEDGFKFLGITGWLCYFSEVSYRFLKQAFTIRKDDIAEKSPIEKAPVIHLN